MSIDKRLISTGAAVCTADTLDIFEDSSCVALYGLNYDGSDAGGNYNGTPTNVTFNAPGYIDYAASFNGSSSRIDSTSISAWPSGNAARSISFWMYSDSYANGGIVAYGTAASNQAFAFYISSSQMIMTFYGVNANINYALSTGQWYHVVATHDGTTFKAYINGSEEYSDTRTLNTGTAGFRIGGVPWNNGGEFFNGKIDQVRIFNKALSSSEVTTLYGEVACEYTCTTDTNGFPASASSDLVAYYKLDNDATDETGTHNATATNVTFGGGRYGAAASLNGSSSIDTGISTTNFVSDLNDRTVDFSFSCWTQIDSYPQGDNTIFYIGNYNVYSPNYAAIILDFRSGNKKIRFTHQTQYIESTSTFNSPTGWVHVVGVRESSVLKLYINGSLEANVTLTANTGVSSSTTLDLGGFKFGGATVYGGLDGKLDQIRMYSSALSSAEVSSLYEEEHQCYITVNSTDPFGDSSNVALYEFENNANDSTGSYNGTASNVTYSTDSIIGTYAGSFNGTNSKIVNTSFNAITGNAARSISFWYKTTNDDDTLVTLGSTTGAPNNQFSIVLYTSSIGIYGLTGPYDEVITGWTNDLTSGVWQHLVVTWDGQTGGTLKAYLNGNQEIKTLTRSAGKAYATTAGLQLGNWGNNDRYYNGKLDQVRIFNKELNVNEVWQLYAEGAKG
jgi:hypothetical protein